MNLSQVWPFFHNLRMHLSKTTHKLAHACTLPKGLFSHNLKMQSSESMCSYTLMPECSEVQKFFLLVLFCIYFEHFFARINCSHFWRGILHLILVFCFLLFIPPLQFFIFLHLPTPLYLSPSILSFFIPSFFQVLCWGWNPWTHDCWESTLTTTDPHPSLSFLISFFLTFLMDPITKKISSYFSPVWKLLLILNYFQFLLIKRC